MNDQPIRPTSATNPASAPTEPGSAEPQQSLFAVSRSWWIATGVAVIMVVLALLGVGISTTSGAQGAATYWISLIPIYGALCVGTAWARGRHAQGFDRLAVLRQLFHWLGIAVAVGVDFLVRSTGVETGTAAGLNALLLLALGCYLAGVHLEWLFIVVGLLLTLTLICVVKAEQYLWLIFVVGGIAIALMFVLQRLLYKKHSAKLAAVQLPQSAQVGS